MWSTCRRGGSIVATGGGGGGGLDFIFCFVYWLTINECQQVYNIWTKLAKWWWWWWWRRLHFVKYMIDQQRKKGSREGVAANGRYRNEIWEHTLKMTNVNINLQSKKTKRERAIHPMVEAIQIHKQYIGYITNRSLFQQSRKVNLCTNEPNQKKKRYFYIYLQLDWYSCVQ